MSETTTDLLSHLKQSKGVTEKTINLLSSYGFNSSDTLMAMDVSKDLPQLTDINLGQRALLRQLIKEYKTSYSMDKNRRNDSDEDMDVDENCCHNCHNKTIVDKMKGILSNELKDSFIRYKLALVRSRKEVTKLRAENLSKEIEVKKLNSEIHRLRNKTTERSNEQRIKKMTTLLEEKDNYIKELKKKVSKENKQKTEIVEDFREWHKNCLKDLSKLKTYLSNESLVIHRYDPKDSEESLPIESIIPIDTIPLQTTIEAIPEQPSIETNQEKPSIGTIPKRPSIETIPEPPQLEPIVDENTSEIVSNSEPKNFSSDIKPPELVPEVVTEKTRKERHKKAVRQSQDIDTNDNQNESTIENYISLNESVMSADETLDESIPSPNTTSKVVRVTEEMAFQYLSPNEINEISGRFDEHNYSAVNESSITKSTGRARTRLSGRKFRSNSYSQITRTKRESISKNAKNCKKLKTRDAEDIEDNDNNKSINLVVFSTEESTKSDAISEEVPPSLRRDSVTLSSITGSKLISIDISGESDGNMTDTNSLTLQQSVVSIDEISQIATSNGYLSDSNEENRCSIVNAVAPITTGLMSELSTETIVQKKKLGYKCSRDGCDFATLFEPVFNDHIHNHVPYRFGQEIPDDWRQYFEEFKKDLPQFKSN